MAQSLQMHVEILEGLIDTFAISHKQRPVFMIALVSRRGVARDPECNLQDTNVVNRSLKRLTKLTSLG